MYLLFPDARAGYEAHEEALLDWYYGRLAVHLAGGGAVAGAQGVGVATSARPDGAAAGWRRAQRDADACGSLESHYGYSRAALELHYRLAQADFLAYSVANGWAASAPRDAVLVARVAATLAELDGGSGALSSADEYTEAIGVQMNAV